MGKLVIKEVSKQVLINKLKKQFLSGEITLDELTETIEQSTMMAKQLGINNSVEMIYIEN